MRQFDYIMAFIGQLGHATTPAEICERLIAFMAGLRPAAAVHEGVSRPGMAWQGQGRQGQRPAGWLERQATSIDADCELDRSPHQEPMPKGEDVLPIRFGSDGAEDTVAKDEPPEATPFPPAGLDRRTRTMSLGDEAADLSPAELDMVSLAATCAIGRAVQLQGEQAQPTDRTELTPRERECLQLAAIGKSEREISRLLGISEHTSEKHLLNAKAKLGAANRVQAVAEAIRRGYIH